jgi:hypothetical protein
MAQQGSPKKKSTPINQLPDVQPPQQKQPSPQQLKNQESDDELVKRVLNSMQEPSQVNIQEVSPQSPKKEDNLQQQITNEEIKEDSLTNRLFKEGREPLLIAGLAYLSNQEFVTNFIQKYLPKVVEEGTNNVSTFGFIIKALLIGILFYVIKKYILSR